MLTIQYKIPSTSEIFSCTSHMRLSIRDSPASNWLEGIKQKKVSVSSECFCLFHLFSENPTATSTTSAISTLTFQEEPIYIGCQHRNLPVFPGNLYAWSSDRSKPLLKCPRLQALSKHYSTTDACTVICGQAQASYSSLLTELLLISCNSVTPMAIQGVQFILHLSHWSRIMAHSL